VAVPSLRSETAGLVRLAERDLHALWRLVANGASAEVALRDLLPAIIREYGQMGAALAANWYDDQRAKVDTRSRFTAIPVAPDDRGAHALIGWALATATDDVSLHTLVAGGTQRRVADHLRLTITGSSLEDPAATGWVRVGHGECFWCRQYLDGEVRTVAYDFDAHDGCNCHAVPSF
jgi:hypothetical protein